MRKYKIHKGSQAYKERQDRLFWIGAYTVVTVLIFAAILIPGAVEYAVSLICG